MSCCNMVTSSGSVFGTLNAPDVVGDSDTVTGASQPVRCNMDAVLVSMPEHEGGADVAPLKAPAQRTEQISGRVIQ